MKLHIFASAALALLTAANGVMSEEPSIRGVIKAAADAVADSVVASKSTEDSLVPDEDAPASNKVDPDDEHSDDREDEDSEDEEMEDVDRYDDGVGRRSAYRRGAARGYTAGRRSDYRGDRRDAYRNGARRGYRAGSRRDRRSDRYVGRSGSTYRRGYTGPNGRRKGYGYGRCWPSCRPPAEAEGEELEVPSSYDDYGDYDDYDEDYDLDGDAELEDVDYTDDFGGRSRAYRRGAVRGYRYGRSGGRRSRAYRRGAVRGYAYGRSGRGRRYGRSRARAYARGARRGYRAGGGSTWWTGDSEDEEDAEMNSEDFLTQSPNACVSRCLRLRFSPARQEECIADCDTEDSEDEEARVAVE